MASMAREMSKASKARRDASDAAGRKGLKMALVALVGLLALVALVHFMAPAGPQAATVGPQESIVDGLTNVQADDAEIMVASDGSESKGR